MTEKELLCRARGLIADPKHWCRGAFARDDCGVELPPGTDESKCWCAVGALAHAGEVCGKPGALVVQAAIDLLHAAGVAMGQRYAYDVNDNLGHESVLRMYDLAIAAAPGPE